MKIIHIAPEGQYDSNVATIERRSSATWATPFSIKTLEYTKKYDIEVWKTYDPKDYGNHGISVREKYGITFKLFPARKIGPKYISIPLLKELRKRIKSKEKILVHLQSIHDVMPYLIAFQCRKIPLVAQQRGPNCPPILMSYFYNKFRYLLLAIIDSLSLKYFDYFFVCSIGEYGYLPNKVGKSNVMFLKGGGFEFSKYVPRSKGEVRRELGLPLDKRIILHVGRLSSDVKGFRYILEAFKELQKKYNVELIFIGEHSNKKNATYLKAKELGAIMLPRLPREVVLNYINAADVYAIYVGDPRQRYFAGFGTGPLEALSLNTPIVSSLIVNFASLCFKEKGRIGLMPESKEDIARCISTIFEWPEKYTNTRDIVKKYYSWDKVIRENIKVYQKLFERYYY